MNHGKRVFGENCANCEQAQGKLPWRCDLTHVKKTQTCELQRPRLCVITLRNYSAINREWGGPWAATIKDHLSKFRGERSCSVGGLTCFGAKIIWAGRFICLYTYKQNIFKRVLRRVGSSGTPLSDKLESAKKKKIGGASKCGPQWHRVLLPRSQVIYTEGVTVRPAALHRLSSTQFVSSAHW